VSSHSFPGYLDVRAGWTNENGRKTSGALIRRRNIKNLAAKRTNIARPRPTAVKLVSRFKRFYINTHARACASLRLYKYRVRQVVSVVVDGLTNKAHANRSLGRTEGRTTLDEVRIRNNKVYGV